MKKILSLTVLLFTLLLVGCTSQSANNPMDQNESVNLSKDQSLAISTYLASGLLSTSTGTDTNMSYNFNTINRVAFLASTEETELAIETELDDVNVYFNKLKALIDSGIESALTINEQPSTMEAYDTQITYSIEDVTYTIYYSFVDELPVDETNDENIVNTTATTESSEEDDEDEDDEKDDNEDADKDDEKEEEQFSLIGLMIIDGVSYELTGANEIEGTESKMWFETTDVNNTGNYVKVEIKNEDSEQKFELKSSIDGNEQEAEIKFETEDNETKVELELVKNGVESSYEFKKEVEDEGTVYKFEYEIGEVEGEVKIIETTDDTGNPVYTYKIEEEGKHKEIEKDKERGHSDEDDTEEDD